MPGARCAGVDILDIIGLQWRDFWGKLDKYDCRLQEGGKDIHATLLRVPCTVKYSHNEYPRPTTSVMPTVIYLVPGYLRLP